MRLVIDLQADQGASHKRGIGRYSRELAMAMARRPGNHEVIVTLSGAYIERAEHIAASFSAVLAKEQIRIWHAPPGIAALAGASMRPFAEVLRAQFIASLQPDIVHVCSMFEGLGDDLVTVQPLQFTRLPVIATCYDLIPLIRDDEYFGVHSHVPLARDWYYRILHEMTMCEGLLAISNSSRQEAIDHLPFPEDRVFNIQAGIAPDFRPAELSAASRATLLDRYGLRPSFILFLGGGDIRKNEAGLIAAYARLPARLRARHSLVVVGGTDPETTRRTAAKLAIPREHLVTVPFVAEADLSGLYSLCALFVFPSFHEGFGLPVAEAMACGAPVIASNTTSLPEVIGRDDATFDPSDPASISACMRKVLENPAFAQELAAYGRIQAAQFTWESSAKKAWTAIEDIHARALQRGPVKHGPVLPHRPSLAFISPMRPQATGIADYASDLLPCLARHYDITVVCEEEIGDVRLKAAFARLDPAGFLREATRFDRVLYQIGNSPFHRFQIEALLPYCPGVVALHDAFLSAVMNWLAYEHGRPEEFRATLWQSHGYEAVQYDSVRGREASVRRYPCTLPVLRSAMAVIVHSRHGGDVLEAHFGAGMARDISVVPMPRTDRARLDRETARASLGLAAREFVVCSFGSVASTKCPELVAEAWRLAAIGGTLVFAGEVSAALRRALAEIGPRIVCTERLSREQYQAWLAAADMAVQWRRNSRGETSAAAADALLAGLPTIVNAHGSAAELPRDAVMMLADDADAAQLADAIRTLHGDPLRRARLAANARAFALQSLTPEAAADRYRDVIEAAYATALAPVLARQMPKQVLPVSASGLRDAAACTARSFPSPRHAGGRKRFLIDVSDLSRRDHGTGVSRVALEIARRALQFPGKDYIGQTVRCDNGRLRATHDVALRLLGLDRLDLPEVPIDAVAGDILVCADLNGTLSEAEFHDLRRLRLSGVRIVLVVYDLLPIRHPELFLPAVCDAATAWYARMTAIADLAACISGTVAQDLFAWLDENPGRRSSPLEVGSFGLGADFPALVETMSAVPSPAVRAALDAATRRPTVLMAGTVEPRKGHRQALAAFSELWRQGVDIGLTIAGKLGWNMDDFAAELGEGMQSGDRLHWLRDCGDAELAQVYRSGRGLLMASTHEGFGLPIVEAARAGLPVLARDIPVFREVAGPHARYFSGDAPEDLAAALRDWLRQGFAPASAGMRVLSWDESFASLRDLIFGIKPCAIWRPR